MSCRAAQELAAADFDVRAWGSVLAEDGDAEEGGGVRADSGVPEEEDLVEEEVFDRWLESGTLELASAVSTWGGQQEPAVIEEEQDAQHLAWLTREWRSERLFSARITPAACIARSAWSL